MADRAPEQMAVKIAGAVGAFALIIVLLLAVLVPEQLWVAVWIVIVLAAMGVALAWFAGRRSG